MGTLIDQNELPAGYTIIESTHAILGTGTVRKVAIKGGKHPKMRLLVADVNTKFNDGEGLSADWSFVLMTAKTTAGQIITVSHKDGIVAGASAAEALVNEIYPIAIVASTDESIFEADEDVIIAPSTVAGSAADAAIVVLKFEVVN